MPSARRFPPPWTAEESGPHSTLAVRVPIKLKRFRALLCARNIGRENHEEDGACALS